MKSYNAILRDVQASYRGSTKQALVSESQSLLQIYFLKPASIYLTPLFVWTRLTPNQVTWLGFLVGLAACVLLGTGEPPLAVLGAWLYLVHRVLDHVDGNVARYSGRTSSYGHFLDGSLGAIIQMALFIGVGIGTYRQCRSGDAWGPEALSRHPEFALVAGALASSIWMVARFIKLQHDGIFEAGPEAAAAGRPGRGPGAGLLWQGARRARGIVPVVRVGGLIVAAYTGTLTLYLGFFALYIPAAFAIQYARLVHFGRRFARKARDPMDPR